MENTKKIQKFLENRPYLLWWTKDYQGISQAAIVESVLNYGNWQDVQTVFRLIGLKESANIFKKQIKNKRHNYRPKTKNYWQLYFKKYA